MTNLSVNDHSNQRLMSCVERGDLAGIALLLSQGVDPRQNQSYALSRAAHNGYSECVKLLIPASDPKAENSYALCMAAGNGHAECVRLLIPVSDPKTNDSNALRWAAVNGHLDCVNLLLPVSAPLIEVEDILSEALGSGHAGILSSMLAHEPLLLARMDLATALDAAVAENHVDLQALLLSIIEKQHIDAHISPSPAATQKPSRL